MIVSEFVAELGPGLRCVTVRLQASVAYQNHWLALPIRFLAISFQPLDVCRYPAAVTVAIRSGPGARVAVSTTLKLLSVVTAS